MAREDVDRARGAVAALADAGCPDQQMTDALNALEAAVRLDNTEVLEQAGWRHFNAVPIPARERVDLTPLTLAELRLRYAQLTATAERLRLRSTVGDPTTRRTASLSRDARMTQRRADDYAAVLVAVQGDGL